MYRKTFTFDGKRYDLTAKTKEELDEKVARRKLELEQGYVRIDGNMTVKEWANEWLTTYKEGEVGIGWYKTMNRLLKSFVFPSIGHYKLRQVKSAHIQKILKELSGYSHAYIRQVYVVMNDMFTMAYNNALIVRNPMLGVIIPKGREEAPRRAITDSERYLILTACEKHKANLFIKNMLYCGLRPGESAAMKWNNVDLENGIMKVRQAIKSDGKMGSPKTKNGMRDIPIPIVYLEELRSLYSPEKAFDYLTVSNKGTHYTMNGYSQLFDSLVELIERETGIVMASDLSAYCLRHTYCTDLQSAGVPINVAKDLMGHASINTTSKIYTHFSDVSFESARDKINAFTLPKPVGSAVGDEKTPTQ